MKKYKYYATFFLFAAIVFTMFLIVDLINVYMYEHISKLSLILNFILVPGYWSAFYYCDKTYSYED